jgi:hypothetical protein
MSFEMSDDLSGLKDDMIAFITGHGLLRFRGYVGDEAQSVMWDPNDHPDSWKDFVELAKASGAPFLTMSDVLLEGRDLDRLVERLRNQPYGDDEDMEDARWLRTYVGKTGFVQLGFPYQGTLFLYEASTHWYERYQRLLDLVDEFGGVVIDGSDQED